MGMPVQALDVGAQMFCVLTTVPAWKVALRGAHAGDAARRRAAGPAPPRRSHDLHAAAARGAREAGGHQVGVGKAGLGLVADQRRVVEARDGQQRPGLRRVEQVHRDALAAGRQRRAQRLEPVAFGRGDQVAAPDQPGRGLVVADVAGEVRSNAAHDARASSTFSITE
jgi:hypothetical protein